MCYVLVCVDCSVFLCVYKSTMWICVCSKIISIEIFNKILGGENGLSFHKGTSIYWGDHPLHCVCVSAHAVLPLCMPRLYVQGLCTARILCLYYLTYVCLMCLCVSQCMCGLPYLWCVFCVCVCACAYVHACMCALTASEQLLPWLLHHKLAIRELFIEEIATSSQSLQIFAHHQFCTEQSIKQLHLIMFAYLYHRVQNRTSYTHAKSLIIQ